MVVSQVGARRGRGEVNLGYGWLPDLPDRREDSGAMLRGGIKTLVKQGVCAEARWPHVVSRFAHKPPAACFVEARDHQVTAYVRLETVDQMRACLADGFPSVFGFSVTMPYAYGADRNLSDDFWTIRRQEEF